jgi:purine-cytosine permease-like protein
VAVAGGLGISRYIGIDDFITAVWIGGLCLSITAWGWSYLKKKNKLNSVTGFFVFFLVYFSALLPLYKLNYIGLVTNKLWGIDKILFGTVVGTIVFWLGVLTYTILKKRNEGKVYFPFQRVVIPVGFLVITSLVYYILCKCTNLT